MDIVTAEMLAELDSWIQSGRIIVEPANAMYFGRIESRFPIAVNRIDWSKVGSVKEIVLRPSPDSVTILQMRKEIRGRLHEI